MAHALSKLPVQQLTNCGTFHRGCLLDLSDPLA